MADPGFPRRRGGGWATPKVRAPIYHLAKFFPKTAWKWKNLDPGENIPCPAFDPPMFSKTKFADEPECTNVSPLTRPLNPQHCLYFVTNIYLRLKHYHLTIHKTMKQLCLFLFWESHVTWCRFAWPLQRGISQAQPEPPEPEPKWPWNYFLNTLVVFRK